VRVDPPPRGHGQDKRQRPYGVGDLAKEGQHAPPNGIDVRNTPQGAVRLLAGRSEGDGPAVENPEINDRASTTGPDAGSARWSDLGVEIAKVNVVQDLTAGPAGDIGELG
jgi:hypothetical protein